MSKLESILNPENASSISESAHVNIDRQLPTEDSSLPSNSPPAVDLRGSTSSSDHKPHPNCPNSLDCLRDTNDRPKYTLAVIIRCAILGSPNQRLPVRRLYEVIGNKFPYYKKSKSCQQSIRHLLSSDKSYERIPRTLSDPGPGFYWRVVEGATPGMKKPRKRGPKTAEGKKRGRLRRSSPSDPEQLSNKDSDENEEDLNLNQDKTDGPVESEADSNKRVHNRQPTNPSTTCLAPVPQSFSRTDETLKAHMKRTQMENDILRQQSAQAVSISLKLSAQLSETQIETSKLRAQLRETQQELEVEHKKRREAENALNMN